MLINNLLFYKLLIFLFLNKFLYIKINKYLILKMGIGDWGLGIGD